MAGATDPLICGEPGFKRLWRMPNRAFRGATLARLSARGQYLHDRSRERYERRPDAWLAAPVLTGEIGVIEGVRFIMAPLTDYLDAPLGA